MLPLIVLLILTCILNIIDCAQTVYAIQIFGVGVESNPIARWMFENDCAITLKLTVVPVVLVVIGIVVYIDRRFRWVVYGVLGFYLYIVLSNYFALVEMGAI
jgi:hypothetical protein